MSSLMSFWQGLCQNLGWFHLRRPICKVKITESVFSSQCLSPDFKDKRPIIVFKDPSAKWESQSSSSHNVRLWIQDDWLPRPIYAKWKSQSPYPPHNFRLWIQDEFKNLKTNLWKEKITDSHWATQWNFWPKLGVYLWTLDDYLQRLWNEHMGMQFTGYILNTLTFMILLPPCVSPGKKTVKK